MKLSVVVVNYNVKSFLEQALLSVRKASRNLAVEIFVVDNHSVDGSVEMLKQKFPEIILIENKENVGFSRANNQAIKISKGEYVLLLNPDTVVEEDTFEKCIRFMDEHADAGALGVKMLDGSGKFLPESKRGFPTPAVAFYKAFGLTKLFPRSKTFAKYYLGNLSPDETNEAEVLAGAFMLLRKKALDQCGLLDENFFMYGEDIDLSYRVIKSGWKNYYFADTRIIHYKGESTKRGSLNYVRMFYMAMIVFARKHFSQQRASGLIFMLNAAIYLRASLALIRRFISSIAAPAIDGIGLYAAMLFFKNIWETKVKASEGVNYPPQFIFIVVPVYILVWLLSVYFSGGYDRNSRPSKIIRGLLIGTLIISAVYGFLDDSLRFSRAMILLGFVFGVFFMCAWRFIRHW
ncbi:MAG TPA: glycosyl transferase family 2, partial [Bacteroidetes bacterium]|nr:glycosyl transferase family 2 [Bacteroidota bacterium]